MLEWNEGYKEFFFFFFFSYFGDNSLVAMKMLLGESCNINAYYALAQDTKEMRSIGTHT